MKLKKRKIKYSEWIEGVVWMLECTSASDPYATYPSLSERIGINVSAVRKLIDGMVTLHLSYTIIFFCFCCHSATSTAETLSTKGKQGWWQQGGRWQQCVCHHARIRRFLRWKTAFSTQENAVFTVVNGLGESFCHYGIISWLRRFYHFVLYQSPETLYTGRLYSF